MRTLTLAIFLLFSSLSSADYIKGGLGVSISGDTTLKSGGAELEKEHKVMMMFPMIAAYGLNVNEFIAIEGELSLRTTNYKDKTVSNSITSNNIAINVVGTLPESMMLSNFNVFGGLGIAYGQYALGGATEKELGSAAQAFIGFDYTLESKVKLGLEYRYFQSIPEIDLGSGVEADYLNTSAIFSAKFPF